ncbi:MAG TPA: ligase-associated DNA damage response endonuclease PdeM [Longimicrobiaceae bacterium]|nr:ligase-associated DNA damage response endonuclease PdeM [Longimicrobiaceae bacterium]
MSDAVVELRGERLRLLPERAAFWEGTGTLLAADLHWGKAAAFRASGVAVPGGGTADDLARLSGALERTGARRLVLLGDLFHARAGRTAAVLDAARAWRARHPAVEVVLVPGNHDRHAGPPPPGLELRVVPEGTAEPPFVLAHHPEPSAAGYVLAGHLHPGVVLRGAARMRQRLPCFWLGAEVGVLPAFGGFTGLAEVRPRGGDRVWVVAGEEVVEVPPGPGRA